ncbi:LuxR family transcriptional regulator [Sphaerisporangium album]|uniref:LuxR family transcriptional regulator n=1 Tax=Sphaerisporangium album TaxID=509200 RepID=A0A367EWB3_9ACTN|nr:LuxR family transcriptional regulator [Sphaerisporangium album]RCG22424.1 LuxR family transcriptional regulator [Sphaerisporangium album]
MRVSSPVLVGRGDELDLIKGRLAATRDRRGDAVFVVGEAGIGKTRLVGECARHAADAGMVVLRGRGSAVGPAVPFRAVTEALLSLLRAADVPLDDSDLAPYRPALARLVPDWRGHATPGTGESVIVLAEAVLRLLAIIGRDRGCLMILDDLHDADAETLAVVEYLADNLADQPAVLLVTLQPGAHAAGDVSRAAVVRRAATAVTLRPLDEEQVRALAAACLGIDAGDLPGPVSDRLTRDADGIPFVVEELLGDLLDRRVLVRDGGGWRLTAAPGNEVPSNVLHGVAQRAAGLAAATQEVLHLAAVLGRQFPVEAVRAVLGLDESTLFGHLRAGVDAQLLVPDPAMPDWYAFRHSLIADALLAVLPSAERASLARRAADAVSAAHPGLPDDWCQFVAGLRLAAGDAHAAALLLAEAGRRALAAGATASAVTLLERSYELVPDGTRADDRARVLESFLQALAEAGQADRAFTVAARATWASVATLSAEPHVALHARLAWLAVVTGRWAEGAMSVKTARAVLGASPEPGLVARIDVVEAHLILNAGLGLDRAADAERLARHAVTSAAEAGLPEVACQALQLLAMIARRRGFDEADAHLSRMLALAERHDLRMWQINALFRLGVNESMRMDEQARLDQARQAARQTGAIMLGYSIDVVFAMRAVMHADFEEARALADRCASATARLRNVDDQQFAVLTAAAAAAHQARRQEMESLLAEFTRLGGARTQQAPLVSGFCQATCALLEEDRQRAMDELDQAWAWEEENPPVFYLTGRHGLRPLLLALASATSSAEGAPGSRDAGLAEYTAGAANAAADLRWNRQFLHLTHAVLLGRDGHHDAAATAVAEAMETAAPYHMARHLGLRLVAEAALADGWGDPVTWLHTAEEYFHQVDVPAVAAACRALLRKAGVTVAQRRTGHDRIPAELRKQGVTVREYQVLQLLTDRHSNHDIALRLHLSTRTVEKHVASLLARTGRPNRVDLAAYATELSERER